MNRILLLPLVLLFGCVTFEDLAETHPFTDCPDDCRVDVDGVCVCPAEEECQDADDESCCPMGSALDDDGECVVVTANNATNGETNNDTTPPPDEPDCESPDGDCCGDEICCDVPEGFCCSPETGEIQECNNQTSNTTTTSPLPLQDLALVLVDVSDQAQCDATVERPGADFYGVAAELDGQVFQGMVVALEPGPDGRYVDEAVAEEILSQEATPDQCPDDPTRTLSLGCGGWIAVTAGSETVEVDRQAILTVKVAETGPDCDGFEDQYDVWVCPTATVADFVPTEDSGCYRAASSVSGWFELSVPVSALDVVGF